MDYKNLFVSRNLLFETGRNQFFKNIVFVSREDKDFLYLIGNGMFEGFSNNKLINELKDLKKTSYLLKSLMKESQFQLLDYKEAYFNSNKDLIKEKIEDDTIIEATVESKFLEKSVSNYKMSLHEENILLYFPVLESWFQYMLPKMENETFETRELIKSCVIPVQKWKRNRKVLLETHNHDLIEHFI